MHTLTDSPAFVFHDMCSDTCSAQSERGGCSLHCNGVSVLEEGTEKKCAHWRLKCNVRFLLYYYFSMKSDLR